MRASCMTTIEVKGQLIYGRNKMIETLLNSIPENVRSFVIIPKPC